ncbi:MAG: GNAT family N-acetyltransferase [Bacteroidales bacterium]|jgi:RimJ/RimL family protein N-acetyltransferase|nr:GNAT family N-acetyltransferase [Bacteroidales bacterium]
MYQRNTKTRRLLIRDLHPEDIPTWRSFFINNPSLPYLGLDLSLTPEQQSKDWIERQIWRYENNNFGHHALINRKTGQFIGQCGLLTQEVEGKEEVEIGYHILQQHQGVGYATEAAKHFLDYAFNNNITDSLISVIDIRNTASQRVAEKIGMTNTKQIKYYDLDVFIYRIDKP